jgi:hypothetical protein
MVMGPLSFIVGKRAALFSRVSGGALSPLCLVIPAIKSPWLWMYLRWSFLLAPLWMIELGSAELPLPLSSLGTRLKTSFGSLT